MKTITIRDLRQRWPEAEAALQVEDEILVTRDSRPVAKLVRLAAEAEKRPRWSVEEHARWQKRVARGKLARSDAPLVRLLGLSYYGALLRKGIEIRELGREILHAKVMLIDGDRTVIGSANLDQRSFHRNYELNGIIDDVRFGKQIKRMLLKDFAVSRKITPEDHERRGVITRILERAIDLFGWFL